MGENAQVPPVSNRGVQSSNRSALRACVDWVQVTFQTVQESQKIYEILGIDYDQFSADPGGIYGYRTRHSFGHIWVLSDHPVTPGYHVQMSGQGCREFELLSNRDWNEFIAICFASGGKFVRLDTAIDDIARTGQKPYFTMDKLYRKVKEAAVTSLFKRGKKVESFLIEDGSSLGETLYFGQASSDIQLRFYEKDFEREAAGKELESDIVAWNRTELQLRRDRAHLMAMQLIERPDDYLRTVCGVLRNYLNFRVKSATENNKSKWAVCSWWVEFLQDAEKLKLTMVAPDATIERTEGWISKQVHPALAMVWYAMGSSMEQIAAMLEDGLDRLNDKQIKLAHEFMEKRQIERDEMNALKTARMAAWMGSTHRQKKTLPEGEPESVMYYPEYTTNWE